MIICEYKPSDKLTIKRFIASNLQDIFNSKAKNLDDVDDIPKNFELFLIAKENKTIIGTAGLKDENGTARISRMYVQKELRGKGIGKELLKRLLGYCKGKFSRVILSTYPRMNAIDFYEKMGFRVFKRDERIWMEKSVGLL